MAYQWLVVAGIGLLGFLVLLSFVVASGGVDQVDIAIMRGDISVRMPALTVAARVITTIGSFPVVAVVAGLTAVLLWRRTRTLVPSAVLLASVVVTAAIVFLSKIAVGRVRPPVDAVLGAPSLDYAFPSGHTTNGSVVYLLSALLLGGTLTAAARHRLVLVAILVAVAIGLSRVYLGYHWTTDVLAGWLLATAVVLSGAYAAQRLTAGAVSATIPPPTPPGRRATPPR